MRISAGKFKNRRLFPPKGLKTRPTSGKLREAVFNILQQAIEEAAFLDLFAGSGAMGFEALSRGAAKAVFIDDSLEAVRCMKMSVDALQVGPLTRVIKGDLYRALKILENNGESFEVIYADPPYWQGRGKSLDAHSLKVLKAIDEGSLLKNKGSFFIEDSKETDLEETPLKSLKFLKRRDFGRSSLFQFERFNK